MKLHIVLPIVVVTFLGTTLPTDVAAADPAKIEFAVQSNQVVITASGKPVATYVFRDDKITRPYFAHVHVPGGIQVTRNHPPQKGDAKDHATYHPGICLAFGDISGNDYWRLRAKVVHDKFVARPTGGPGRGSFIVRNRYLSAKGDMTVVVETCKYTINVRPAGYLILWDSTFTSDEADFYFGDQEEMGLGVRVATPIVVNSKQGGRILDSEGRVNGGQVWGQQADWCDYSGTIADKFVGITLMPHPKNFRRSWNHARDYGFTAANPFGRRAFTRGETSKVVVKKGQSFRLRFGVVLHSTADAKAYNADAAYADYVQLSNRE